MIDYLALAMKYGGFTGLDKVYLENALKQLSDEQKLILITPPPSVINAYFAEIYQKQTPSAATDYYFELSKALNLTTSQPSFDEIKPFVRLNLGGKSYGFAYESDQEVAVVFSEEKEPVTDSLLFELAQVFPQYKIYVENNLIKMTKIDFDEEIIEEISLESHMVSRISKLKGSVIKLSSYSQKELSEIVEKISGQRYYHFTQREAIIYIKS